MKKNLTLVFSCCLLVFAAILSGCGSGNKPSGPPKMALDVSVVTMRPQRLVLTRELPGRTVASRVSEIRPQVSGIILKRFFEEGALVKAGQLLYQIDPAQYHAAYNQAKAAVAMAEANLPALRLREARYRELVTTHAVGQQDYDNALAALNQALAQLESSKAALEIARINLHYTPIKAPISGRIGRSSVTEGAMVTAYQAVPLATIQQLDPVYVDVSQSTAELLRLERNLSGGKFDSDDERRKVAIILEDDTVYPLEGTLGFRDITVSPSTGSVILRVIVPNPDSRLLPGMFVRAVVNESVLDQAILVPQSGVSRNQKGEPYAWVVDHAQNAQMQMLQLNQAIDDKWLVASGLHPGDKVVVQGLQRLRPGAPVNATESKAD